HAPAELEGGRSAGHRGCGFDVLGGHDRGAAEPGLGIEVAQRPRGGYCVPRVLAAAAPAPETGPPGLSGFPPRPVVLRYSIREQESGHRRLLASPAHLTPSVKEIDARRRENWAGCPVSGRHGVYTGSRKGGTAPGDPDGN